jgi:hypothetical protein
MKLLLFSFSVLVSTTAFAEMHNLNKEKEIMNSRLDERMGVLEATKTCVNRANSLEALNECKDHQKQSMEDIDEKSDDQKQKMEDKIEAKKDRIEQRSEESKDRLDRRKEKVQEAFE